MNENRFRLILAIILFFAGLLRLLKIDTFPPLLTQDEASIAYNAWSISQTGQDEWGNSWPFIFEAFGDAKQPTYIYLTALLYRLFGWELISVRLVSALAGIASVGLLGVLIRRTTQKLELGLLGAFLLATAPWAIHLSRMGLEANLALFFLLAGTLSWQVSRQKKPWPWLIVAALCFALTGYTYIAFRLFVPLWLGIGTMLNFWLNRDKKHRPQHRQNILLIVITFLLILPGFLFGHSTTRLGQVGLVRPEAVQPVIFELRNNCHLLSSAENLPLLRYGCVALWNEFTVPPMMILRSYLTHLSPEFLFLTGDTTIYRNPLLTGAFFFWLLPFYLLGLLRACRGIRQNTFLLAGWFLSLLPSVLSDTPQAIRMAPHLPFVVWLLVLGYQECLELISKKYHAWLGRGLVLGLLLLLVISAPKYMIESFSNSQEWIAHARTITQRAYELQQQGYTVYIDDVIVEPHIFLAYWNRISPQEYQQLDKAPDTDALGFRRPTQLGEDFTFSQPNYAEILCAESREKVAVFSMRDVLKDIPHQETITGKNGVHTFAKLYLFPEAQEKLAAPPAVCLAQ